MKTTLIALVVPLALAARAEAANCKAVNVPVTVPGVTSAVIHGELCLPPGPVPKTVQLLVHTTWHNLRGWDTPQAAYSYVRSSLAAGYATFNVDRFGTGRSTKPRADLVTITTVEDTLHQVIQALRAGSVGGRAFPKVVWV